MNRAPVFVRVMLTAALVVGIYTETGFFTALFAVLVVVGMELLGKINQKVLRDIKEMLK